MNWRRSLTMMLLFFWTLNGGMMILSTFMLPDLTGKQLCVWAAWELISMFFLFGVDWDKVFSRVFT